MPDPSFCRQTWLGLATLVCGFLALPAGAQQAPSLHAPVVLDRKATSHLILLETPPEYPPVAKVNFIEGVVRLELMVTAEGRVGRAHVVYGQPFLAAAALRAARQWVYRPFMTRDGPCAFLTLVDMHFVLHRKKIDSLPVSPERDLARAVQPPAVVAQPQEPAPTSQVRLRLLLNGEGKIIDTTLVKGTPLGLPAARQNIARWSFRPAHWGTMGVPWYLDVDVPVAGTPLFQEATASDPGGRLGSATQPPAAPPKGVVAGKPTAPGQKLASKAPPSQSAWK